jgi:hypothetical protein
MNFGQGRRVATQTGVSSFPLSVFPARIRLYAGALQFLFLWSFMLLANLAVNAQTSSRQYVYSSQPLTSTTSVVTGFSKASQTGVLTAVPGSPHNERLEGGLVAIDGQGKFLFVLNPNSNDISMFQIDQASGALTEVPASPFAVHTTINPNLAPSQPLSITTERSGKFLFVGYYLGDIQGNSSVVSLMIDTSGPSPALVTQQSTELNTGGAPVQLLSDPKGLRLYVGLHHGQNGIQVGGAEVYSIDPSAGKLNYLGAADAPPADGRSIAMDPLGRFFFVSAGYLTGFIDSCILSPVDGTANAASSTIDIGMNNFAGAMLAENSGKFLYTDQTGGVVVYSINQATGALIQLQGPLTNVILGLGTAVADPQGPYLYSLFGGGIHVYQVDQQSGNLTEIPGSPFNSGETGGAVGIAISGNPVQAVSGPAATIFPSTGYFGGGVAVGSSGPTGVFSFVNIGDQNLAINSISITGPNASSFSQTNTCASTLAPNANCSVSINFTPAGVGPLSATLQVADNAPGSPQTLGLNGTGIAPAPAITFSPTILSFPTITEGTSGAAQTLTVISSGTGPLHVSSVSLGGPNPSDFSFTNNCVAPVAPAANCAISLVFNPIGPGLRTASLTITDDAPGSPQTISLSATATAAITAGPAQGGSTSASISAGQTAQFQIQLMPGPGYSGTVSLTCSGAPLGAACQVPASVSIPNGAAAPFTVTVTTSGAALLPPFAPLRLRPVPGLRVLALLALALVFLVAFSNRWTFQNAAEGRRLRSCTVLATAVFCAVLGVAGCGGGSVTLTPPPIITPSGTSTITVTPSAVSSTGKPLELQPIQLTLTVK